MTELVSDQGEEGKEIYQDILELDGENHHLKIEVIFLSRKPSCYMTG